MERRLHELQSAEKWGSTDDSTLTDDQQSGTSTLPEMTAAQAFLWFEG